MSPYFHGLGPKIKMTSAVPIYVQACSPRPDGRVSPETPPKVIPMGGACWTTPNTNRSPDRSPTPLKSLKIALFNNFTMHYEKYDTVHISCL